MTIFLPESFFIADFLPELEMELHTTYQMAMGKSSGGIL
jgi:hypothetical protein